MKTLLVTFSILFSILGTAQTVTNIDTIQSEKEYDNISVKKLYSDSNATYFIIWAKKGVKSHRHANHTEAIIVVKGEGEMTVGENTFTIKKGDHFVIPANTYHSLKVTSKKPMKVVSTQSPEFLGKDRIYKEEEK